MKKTLKEAIAYFKTPEGIKKIDDAITSSNEFSKIAKEEMRMDWSCTCHKGGGCIHHTVYR